MKVFICVSSLLVLFRSRWFHLQISQILLFVKVTIAKVVFYWAMMLHAQILPMNIVFRLILLLSPSCYRWFTLAPGGSNLDIACTVPSYKFIVYFVSFCFSVHLIRSGFTLFQVVPACPKRSYCYWWLQIVPGGCSSFQLISGSSSIFQVVSAHSR